MAKVNLTELQHEQYIMTSSTFQRWKTRIESQIHNITNLQYNRNTGYEDVTMVTPVLSAK